MALIAAGKFVTKGRKGEFSLFIVLWKPGEEMFSLLTQEYFLFFFPQDKEHLSKQHIWIN